MLTRGRPRRDASDRFLVSQLQAARADDRLQRAAKYLPSKSFERAERRLTRAGVSLDTSEWFYFRSPEATGQVRAEAEGWVLWRPDTGEQLAFVPVSPPESAPPRQELNKPGGRDRAPSRGAMRGASTTLRDG